MKKSKIAILMSTYNGEKYLIEQIESILSQKGDFDLTLIVRDDGSNDNTIPILKKYEKENKLIYSKGENLKSALSFIELLYNNPGYDYYAFSDQDDFWLEGKLALAIKAIENEVVPCLYFSNAEYVDADLNSLGGNVYNTSPKVDFYSTLIGAGFLGCTMVFNKNLADIIQTNAKPQFVSMHDSYLARVCVSVNGRIVYDPDIYIKYRQHNDNVIGSTVGKLDAVKRRVGMIFNKNSITLDMQAREIFKTYNNYIPEEYKKWLMMISEYKKNYIRRMQLVFSGKPSFTSMNMSMTIRMSILFGNR